ncbi:MAG: TlyA family RNA methyltransferase [Pseudomonadota bacterium]
MRLDQRLVHLGLAPSRARAQALIRDGMAVIDGVPARKPGQIVSDASHIELKGDACPWVSRAGLKLAHALEIFGVSMSGCVVLDLGASTGGFTEVCLAQGAARVYAVDVGRGQLHERLRADPRVVDLSATHARAVDATLIPERPDRLVADVSFISLTKALPTPLSRLAPASELVLLVKPQFELDPKRIGKGGHVKDPADLSMAVDRVSTWLRERGWREISTCPSPIRGGDGAIEFLLAAKAWDDPAAPKGRDLSE